jgi:hypothetical protein
MSALALSQARFMEVLYSEGACEPGIAIYRRNLLANLGNALAATYPVVQRLVGDAFFREAARQYVLAHPSRSGDLNDYGASFAAFLAQYPHAATLAYLPDVARLEWAYHESYGAPDAAIFDLASLARVSADDYPRIRFQLHPSVRLLHSGHPIAAIWEANQPGADGAPRRVEGEDHVIVHRHEGTVIVAAVEASLWRLVSTFAHGETLGIAAQVGGESLPAGMTRLASDGLLAGFSLAPETP